LTPKDGTDQVESAAVSAQRARAFGRRFRRARIEAGLKPRDIEAKTGVSRALLRQIEAGQDNLTLDTLAALARAIGVPVSVLVAPLE